MSGFVFDYITGDPDNLTGGGDADMNDIQGSFYDVRTWLNSGVLGQLASSLYIVGEIRYLAGSPPDAAWIPCDGRSLTQSGNVKLFNAIGTTYGPGDTPGSTFALPDLRGRVAVGAGQGKANDGVTNLANRPVATKWGVEAVILNATQIPAHAHTASASSAISPAPTGDVAGGYGGPYRTFMDATSGGSAYGPVLMGIGVSTTVTVNNSTGGDQGHDNTQPSLAIPAYIYGGT